MTTLLAIGAIVVSVLIVREARNATDRCELIGLRLVLGGALGNLVRPLLPRAGFLRGHVVDFVAVGRFPVFNVADSCITIGAILLIVRTLRASRREPSPRDFRVSDRGEPIEVPRSSTASGSTGPSRCSPAGAAATCRRCLEAGSIVVDGRAVGKSHKLHVGRDRRACSTSRRRRAAAARTRRRVDVRYDDDDVIVVAKPAGLVVHPGAGHVGRHARERPARALSRDRGRRRPVPARASCTASTATRAASWSSPAPRPCVRHARRAALGARGRPALRRARVGASRRRRAA